jgi:Transposase DNA-binding
MAKPGFLVAWASRLKFTHISAILLSAAKDLLHESSLSLFGEAMDANHSATTRSFGGHHFGACELGDARLTARLAKTANCCLAHPGGTLPDKLNSNADLIGFYRLANNPKAVHRKLPERTGVLQSTGQAGRPPQPQA